MTTWRSMDGKTLPLHTFARLMPHHHRTSAWNKREQGQSVTGLIDPLSRVLASLLQLPIFSL